MLGGRMSRLTCFGILFQFAALPALGQHSMEPKSATHMTIHFFADVVGQKTGGSIQAPSTFNLGSLDLFVHAQPTPEFFALAEVAFEPTVQDYTIDVERMEAGWSPRSWFQMVIGRYHTPLGYWNTAFHHGKWLLTTIENPLLFKFEDEGGPLPVHTIGLLVFGQVDLSPTLSLLYHVGAGNGRGATPDPPQKLMDIHEGKSFIGALHLAISGFRVGGSVYLDKTTPQATPGTEMTEQIFAGDATFTTPPWEVLVEGAWIRHSYAFADPTGELALKDYGAYAQLAYQAWERVRPYFRAEVQRIDDQDLFMQNVPDQVRVLAGIRFDPIDALAVKLEGGNVRIKGENGGYGRFQVAFVY
jgi:hypothetical protein